MSRVFNSALTGANQNNITVASGVENTNLGAWTLMAWVNPTNYGGNGAGTRTNTAGIVIVKDPAFAYNMMLAIENGFDGHVTIVKAIAGFNDNASVNAVSVGANNSVALGVWQHLAATWNGSGDSKIRLYVNAVETPSYVEQVAGVGAPLDDSGGPLYIGNDGPGSNFDDGFGGQIKNVRTWTVALTQSEIASAMNGGMPQVAFVGDNLPLGGTLSPEPNIGVGATGILSSPNPPLPGAGTANFLLLGEG